MTDMLEPPCHKLGFCAVGSLSGMSRDEALEAINAAFDVAPPEAENVRLESNGGLHVAWTVPPSAAEMAEYDAARMAQAVAATRARGLALRERLNAIRGL